MPRHELKRPVIMDLARRPGPQAAAVAVALVLFAVQGMIAARTHTPTVDEFVYVPAGYYHLRTGDLRLESTNPPLLKIAMAAPLLWMDVRLDLDPRWRDNRTGWGAWIFATRFMALNGARYLDAFFAARLVVLALGVVLGVLVFREAARLLSPAAALATVLLFATMPPLIAHSAVATLDVGVTVLVFGAFVGAERFASTQGWHWAALTGVLFGLALAVKGVAALFLPLVPLLVVLDRRVRVGRDLARLAGGAALMAASAWVALLAAYGFSDFPLPAPLVESVRFQLAASSTGEYPAFLDGRWSQTGWWYYYLVALLLKTPIASLALIVAGAAAVVRGRLRDPRDLWIVVPPLFLLYVLSFHYGKNYGIRYLLPAFPFLLLIAGRGVDLLAGAGRAGRAAVVGLLAWQVAASLLAVPHHLAYFNELAGGPDHARRLLLDSNLDWGQDLGRLKAYLEARGTDRVCLGYFGHVDPHVYGIDFSLPPTEPTPGLCAVSANFLAGYPYAVTYAGDRILGVRAGAWSWFDRFRPVARVGRSIWVFDVTADDIARVGGSAAPAAAAVR
ncbi:MAG TPA: glycosyltransferase family 39 protein [Candidatus Binatia bacterium]|nr:glycosyltransferase family 39 protein [Candidatus Binatia bacterium]